MSAIRSDAGRAKSIPLGADPESILAILKRRPCTSRQIADVCGLPFYEVAKHLTALMKANQVRTEPRDGTVYYVDADREGRQ